MSGAIDMGDIVEFRAYASRDRITAAVPAEGAQILFFLGVRYERHEVPVPAKAVRKRSPRAAAGKRKRAVKSA
jgi:hypothetical protein